MDIFKIKKSIHVAAVVDGVPEVFRLEKGQTLKGKFQKFDSVTNQILIKKGTALWALPKNAVEEQ